MYLMITVSTNVCITALKTLLVDVRRRIVVGVAFPIAFPLPLLLVMASICAFAIIDSIIIDKAYVFLLGIMGSRGKTTVAARPRALYLPLPLFSPTLFSCKKWRVLFANFILHMTWANFGSFYLQERRKGGFLSPRRPSIPFFKVATIHYALVSPCIVTH